jgi:hypothetical protein
MFRGASTNPVERTSAPVGNGALPEGPAAGQLYSFQTAPYWEFAPPATNRYGAFKVLGADDNHIAIGVLDGTWPTPPTVTEIRSAPIIRENRFKWNGRLATFRMNRDWWKPEEEVQELMLVGVCKLSDDERSHADAIARGGAGTSYTTLSYVNYVAEGEWRWSHDREQFVAEEQLDKAKKAAVRAAAEERYRTRLSKLTWEQLLSETPFDRWSPSPPFPPEDFTHAARNVIRDACIALQDLGPKPRRADVRTILKKTVQWFNEADEKAGGVIETEEREDICAVLEEMAHIARQKVLVDEIDAWREW